MPALESRAGDFFPPEKSVQKQTRRENILQSFNRACVHSEKKKETFMFAAFMFYNLS